MTQEDGTFQTEPDAVYNMIKGKLLRFRRSYEEKQIIALQDWKCLIKVNVGAIEFEGRWERSIRKLVG